MKEIRDKLMELSARINAIESSVQLVKEKKLKGKESPFQ